MKRDATDAYIRNVENIREHLDVIRAEVDRMIADTDSPTWADVGDLAHVSSELRDVVTFLTGEDR